MYKRVCALVLRKTSLAEKASGSPLSYTAFYLLPIVLELISLHFSIYPIGHPAFLHSST